MIDLSTIRNEGNFSVRSGPSRLALVHYGFRTTQMGAADQRQAEFSPRYASLGLLNLARSAQVDFENGRIPFAPEFRYFDEDCYGDDGELVRAITAWLRPASSRFVMVGLYSLAFDRTAAMLSLIDPREFCVIVGGAHPTVAPNIDFAHLVVRGEGGTAVRHILDTFLEPGFGAGPDADGLCFAIDGHARIGKTVFDQSLAKIPAPAFAYELTQSETSFADTPRERWWKAVGLSQQIYICTQSCRARCTFCSTYLIHGNLVSRPVRFIAGDIDHLQGLGYDSIQFHDDDLLQHDELDDLLDLLKVRGIPWTCNARSEFITPSLASRLSTSGCRKVFLGVESFDQRTLDYYRKATTVAMNQSAVISLEAAGIAVICGYIIGAPHDSLESILEDLDRVLALPIYFLAAAILTPDIGTVEFRRALKRVPGLSVLDGPGMNIRPRPDLFGAGAPYGLPTVAEVLSKEELNEIYGLINCSFFLRDVTLERIVRHTSADRLDEAFKWCSLQRTRAAELARSAKLPEVRRRAEAILAGTFAPQVVLDRADARALELGSP